MKKQKTSELFRFVAVRSPRLKRTSTNTINNIPFPAETINADESAFKLYLSKTTDADSVTSLRIGKAILADFKRSEAYFSSSEAIRIKYAAHLDFCEWLDSVKTTSVSDYKERLKRYFGSTNPTAKLTSAERAQIWDNYLSNAVEQAYPIALAYWDAIIRSIYIIEELNKDGKVNVSSLKNARILLPAALNQQPVLKATETGSGAANEDQTRINELVAQLDSLQAHKLKIENAYQSLLNGPQKTETSLENTENSVESTPVLSLSDKELKMMGTDTQAYVISKLGTRSFYFYSDLKHIIDLNISDTVSELGRYLQTKKKYGYFGGHLYNFASKSANKETTPAAKATVNWDAGCGGDPDNPFNALYPCIFQKNPQAQLNFSIGEFKRVESELHCYNAGEIAHVENVLKGEKKVYETRRLERTEETYVYEKEVVEEDERDVQTTNRYEMEKEVQSIIDTQTSLDAGVNVSAQYGPFVEVDASMNFSTTVSTHDATQQTINFAKSITESAKKRIVTKVSEKRSVTRINEFEVVNRHELNGGDDAHSVGIYRWIDKSYTNRLMNYGNRLMVQLQIPEPAAYHLWAIEQSNSSSSDEIIEKPLHPSDELVTEKLAPFNNLVHPNMIRPLKNHQDITLYNYQVWAAAYGVEVPLPPVYEKMIGKSYSISPEDQTKLEQHYTVGGSSDTDIAIPEGYKAVYVILKGECHNRTGDGLRQLLVNVGNAYLRIQGNNWSTTASLPGHIEKLPVSYETYRIGMADFNLNVVIRRTDELLQQWQMQVYNTIIGAYNNQNAAYQQQLQELKVRAGVKIQGNNPGINKAIIKTELKKNSIEFFRLLNTPIWQHYLPFIHSTAMPAMGTAPIWGSQPIIKNPIEGLINGKYAKFMETAVEWEQMTYELLPYYWAHHDRWTDLYNLKDTDPLFLNFLKAGFASVTIPIKPGYERHFLYYLHTGKLWLGSSVPVIDSDIEKLIQSDLSGEITEPFEEDNWIETVPTTLVILQKDAEGIDETGLPCNG